jgi:hypothetical protein
MIVMPSPDGAILRVARLKGGGPGRYVDLSGFSLQVPNQIGWV